MKRVCETFFQLEVIGIPFSYQTIVIHTGWTRLVEGWTPVVGYTGVYKIKKLMPHARCCERKGEILQCWIHSYASLSSALEFGNSYIV